MTTPNNPGIHSLLKDGSLTVSITHTIPTGGYQNIRPSLTLTSKVGEDGNVSAVFKESYRVLRFLFAVLAQGEASASEGMQKDGVQGYVAKLLASMPTEG